MADIGRFVEHNREVDLMTLARQGQVMSAYSHDKAATIHAIAGIAKQVIAADEPAMAVAHDAGFDVREAVEIARSDFDPREFEDTSDQPKIDLMVTPDRHQRLLSGFERYFGQFSRTERPPFNHDVAIPIFDYRIANFAENWIEVDIEFLAEDQGSGEVNLSLRDIGILRSRSVKVSVAESFFKRSGSFQLVVPVTMTFFEHEGPIKSDLRYTARTSSVGKPYLARPGEKGIFSHIIPMVEPVSWHPFMEASGKKGSNERVDTIERSEGFEATAVLGLGEDKSVGLDYKMSARRQIKTTYRKTKSGALVEAGWPVPERPWHSPVRGLSWIAQPD